jgi:hypothetical protein
MFSNAEAGCSYFAPEQLDYIMCHESESRLVSDVAVASAGSTFLLYACSICLTLLFGTLDTIMRSAYSMESTDTHLCHQSPEVMPYAISQNKLTNMCKLHAM